jgi:hypothetical protein
MTAIGLPFYHLRDQLEFADLKAEPKNSLLRMENARVQERGIAQRFLSTYAATQNLQRPTRSHLSKNAPSL